MLQNTNHNIMPRAEKSAHLAGGMVVVNGQSAFVGRKSTDGAAAVLGSKGFGVPFGSDTVGSLEFDAPLGRSTLVGLLVALNSLAAVFCSAVGALVLRVFGSDRSLLLRSSHPVLLTGGLRLSSCYSIRELNNGR